MTADFFYASVSLSSLCRACIGEVSLQCCLLLF